MIRFSYSNEDTKDEERREKGVGSIKGRLNAVPSAQARTLPQDHAITIDKQAAIVNNLENSEAFK
jgi:hypothetical protein